VQKSSGKLYWYGAGSEILDESDLSGNITDEYVFFGGKRVAHRVVSSGSIYYYAEDFLGTSRVMTTSSGTVCYEVDFYPYGGERVITNTCAQNYKFEGKERDTETQNDNFGARYYISRLGRWLSADWSAVPAPVPYANLSNPQTLNLYAMVRDNPETFADLDGHLLGLPGLYGLNESSALQRTENALEASYAAGVAAAEDPAAASASQAPQTSAQAQIQQGVAARQTYKTRDEAAKAAEKAALAATNKSGRKYEYGGWILKNKDGQYTYTIAVTIKEQARFRPDMVTIPEGFTGVADYHTHPESFKEEGQGLSGRDEQHAYDYHRTVYEADTYSRNMYRFTPGVSAYKPNEWCCGVIGDFVTHIPQ
jgi:RHS repeat-associated protein